MFSPYAPSNYDELKFQSLESLQFDEVNVIKKISIKKVATYGESPEDVRSGLRE